MVMVTAGYEDDPGAVSLTAVPRNLRVCITVVAGYPYVVRCPLIACVVSTVSVVWPALVDAPF